MPKFRTLYSSSAKARCKRDVMDEAKTLLYSSLGNNLVIQQESKFVDQQKSSELAKLIRKLRWIGMEREADLVARALIERFASINFSAGPSDTD